MQKIPSIILALLLFLAGTCDAHSGASHMRDMGIVLNGYGLDEGFQELCKGITQGMDVTLANTKTIVSPPLIEGLPAMFERRLGSPVPVNHRILGHGWTLNESIPRDTLEFLESKFPGKRAEIVSVWKDWANSVIEMTMKKSGLPRHKATALASLLMNVHMLGDTEPGNTFIQYVLEPNEIAKSMDKNLAELLGKESKGYKRFNQMLDKVVKRYVKRRAHVAMGKEASQMFAHELLNAMSESDIGPALNKSFPKTLRFSFSESGLNAAKKANVTRLEKIAIGKLEGGVMKQQKLTKTAFGRGTQFGKQVAKASGKAVAAESVVTTAGIVGKNGSIWIPALKTAAWEGGAVLSIEAGVACFEYCSGAIHKPEFERKLQDAAIKGAAVSGASGIAVVVFSATPGGWVVLGVGFGAYMITDIALTYIHKQQDRKYLTIEDLAPFGITSDTILDIESDTILQPATDTSLEISPDSILEIENDTILDI